MDIVLYVNGSERNAITKTLSASTRFSGTLRDRTSILSPVFILEAENLTPYNYAHIPLFNRYYYITDITSVRAGLWQISCKCDVLMSFAYDIKQNTVIIEDTEAETNRYLSGDQYVASVKKKTDIIDFPMGLSEQGEYILITAGG